MTSEADAEPYGSIMHFDPTKTGVWIGTGAKLNAVCGQSEWIGVAGYPPSVHCLKCKAIVANDEQRSDRRVFDPTPCK